MNMNLNSEKQTCMNLNLNSGRQVCMSVDLNRAKELLEANAYTCVIRKEDSVYASKQRGAKPLLAWVDEGKDFTGFSAADKVVGKAAAFLYVLLKVDAIYAKVISVPAAKVLEDYGISTFFDEKVEAIRNRTNTGFCPMETAVLEIDTPKEALYAIRDRLEKMQEEKG